MGNKIIDGNLNVLGEIYQNGIPVANKHILDLAAGDTGILSSDILEALTANVFGYVLRQPSRDVILYQYVGLVNGAWLIFKAPTKISSTHLYEYEFRVNKNTGEWVYREDSYSNVPITVLDDTTVLSNYTFAHNVEATYKKSISNKIKLTIPAIASQGFISLLTLMSVESNVEIEVDNKSNYATKIILNNSVIREGDCRTTITGKKIIFARCDGAEVEVLIIEEV